MTENGLKNRILFDTNKHSANFGSPYLRTKDIDLKEYNKSFYKHPTNLSTEDYEWITRSHESNILTEISEHVLTLPKLFPDAHGYTPLTSRKFIAGTSSSFRHKQPQPFASHRRRLKQYGHNLKLANDYLEQQRQRFHPRPVEFLSEDELLLSAKDNLPLDYDFHVDERLLRSTVFTGVDGTILEEDEDQDALDEFDLDKKTHLSKTHRHDRDQQHQEQQTFYVDQYTDESVGRLLENIEALHLVSSESFCEGEYEEEGFEVDTRGENPRLLQNTALSDDTADDSLIELERPGTADSADSGALSRPRSRAKLVKYNTTFRPVSSVYDISVLDNNSRFDLSSDATITMAQLDQRVYQNSRRFGAKFDAKVERKKVILKEEADRRKRASGQLVAKKAERTGPTTHEHHRTKSITSLLMAVEAAREAAVVAAATALVDAAKLKETPSVKQELSPFRRHLGPLMPVSLQAVPDSPVIWKTTLHPFKVNLAPISSPIIEDKKSYSFASPVEPLRRVNSARTAPKHADQYTEKSQAMVNLSQAFEATKRTLKGQSVGDDACNKSSSNEDSDDELSVVPVTSLHVEDAIPTIVFDLTEKGAIQQVLLKSQVPVPRPTSASKAQRSSASRSETVAEKESSAKSVQSLISLAQRRRAYVKPAKREVKDLMAIHPISDEQADVERRALVTLFEYCGGRDWVDRTNWCSNEPLKKWFGVGVTVEGYVFELDLSSNNLCGEFPDSISLLRKLEVAIFDDNKLCGALPDYSLSKMPSLVVLSAQHNQLSGTIPFNMLADLTKLTDLWLSHNQFTGYIQDGIEKLVSLANLCLYRNQLVGDIPPCICRLSRMEFLSLGNNALTGPIPHEIISLHQLRTLSLYNNQLSGRVPDWLETIPYLEELELFGNRFSGWVPNTVKDLATKRGDEKKL